MYHIFGLNVVLGLSLSVGATMLLVQRFDPATALESIRARGVTVIPGAPSMWVAFAHFDEAPADAFAGGAPGPVRRGEAAGRRCPSGCANASASSVAEGYGLTEASPIVTSSVGLPPRFGSVGRVLDGIELRVVDDDGDDALVGDAGEIWVRGPNVFAGYLDDPEATARVLTDDGWLRTGDIALLDEDGRLYLVDRAKDLIIVSGFNVFPAEVEDVLAAHPDVAEVGVIGVPHPHTGEAVKAFVVLRAGRHGSTRTPSSSSPTTTSPGTSARARSSSSTSSRAPPTASSSAASSSSPRPEPGSSARRRRDRRPAVFVNVRTRGLGWSAMATTSRGRRIPEATVARLPVYLRILLEQSESGHAERLVGGARRPRRRQRGQGPQGPQLPRHLRHPRRRLRGRVPHLPGPP